MVKDNRLSSFSIQTVFSKIMKYGSHILLLMSAGVLSYMSFVEDLRISPSVRNITTIALVAMVLNYLVWDSYYKNNYNKVLVNDLENLDYCIHKRYWMARRGWTYEALQASIRTYNTLFAKAWKDDVCDQLSLNEAQIIELRRYRKLSLTRVIDGLDEPQTYTIRLRHYGIQDRWLMRRIAKRKYPKSGIKTPRDLLYILSVGKSTGMRINVNKAEHFYKGKATTKLIMLLLGTVLAASLMYEFIDGDLKSALLKLALNLVLLFSSWFVGSVTGVKGGRIKLAVAEEISEKLEEWKNEPATEIPFKIVLGTDTITDSVVDLDTDTVVDLDEPSRVTIEIT